MALTRQQKIQQIQQMYGGGQQEPSSSGGYDINALIQKAQENKQARLAQQPQQAPQEKKGVIRSIADFFTGNTQEAAEMLGQSAFVTDPINKLVGKIPGVGETVTTEELQAGEAKQAQLSQQLREKLAQKPQEEQRVGLERLQTIEQPRAGVEDVASQVRPEASDLTEMKRIGGTFAGAGGELLSGGIFGGAATQTGKLLTSSPKAFNLAKSLGLPATGVTQAMKAPLLQRAGTLAKEGAGLGALFGASEAAKQDMSVGDIAKQAVIGGVAGGSVSGALPFAGAFGGMVGKKASGIGEKAAIRTMDSLIKPLIRDLKYLKNPSRGIIKEGITFNSLEEGAIKVGQRADEIGQEISAKLVAPENAVKRLDLQDAFAPLEEALTEARKNPRTNSGLIKRLENVRDDILGVDEVTGRATRQLSDLSPQEAFELKKAVDAVTKYTGQASDDTLINKALQRSRRKIKDEINKNVDGLAELNERYSDLITAKNVIKYRDQITSRQNIFPLAAKIGNIGGIIAGTVSLNPAVIATAFATTSVEKLLGSPAFKTRLAQWLAKATPKELEQVAKQTPQIAPIIDTLLKNIGVRIEPQIIENQLDQVTRQTSTEPDMGR